MKLRQKNTKPILFNIIIAGTGATGSQLIAPLTQLLANTEGHRLTVIDGDIFEKKNTINQKCLPEDEGKSKALVIQSRYKRIYPSLNMIYDDVYIKDAEYLIDKLNKTYGSSYEHHNYFPILVGCVDNNATRKLFMEVFHDERMKELIYIDSGNGTLNMLGQTVVGFKKSMMVKTTHGKAVSMAPKGKIKSPCAGDLFEDIVNEKDSIDKATSCANVVDEHPQNIGTNFLAAAVLFSHLNNIISFENVTPGVSYFDAGELPGIVTRGASKK